MLMLMAPALVEFALAFGPSEYFALMVLALTAITGLSGKSAAKGVFATLVGLALGTIGIDLQTGQARFTFGAQGLLGGMNVVIVTVGLFAVGEVFWYAATRRTSTEETVPVGGPVRLTREEWRRSFPAWIRGTVIGFFTGILPGAGATVASFLSYDAERRFSKAPEEFGDGAIEGVAGPEAANNASAGGSLVPLLALGIPGSGTTAVMLAAFQMYGLQPGPLLFAQDSVLVWGLIASLYVSNVLLLVLNLPLIKVWVRLLQVPTPLLFAAVLAFSTLGVYTLNNNIFDVAIVYLLGILAFFMRRYGFPHRSHRPRSGSGSAPGTGVSAGDGDLRRRPNRFSDASAVSGHPFPGLRCDFRTRPGAVCCRPTPSITRDDTDTLRFRSMGALLAMSGGFLLPGFLEGLDLCCEARTQPVFL